MSILSEKKITVPKVLLNLVFIIICLLFILPLLLVLSISFSSEQSILLYGYQLIPREFTVASYEYILTGSRTLINAYGVTIFTTVIGTLGHVFLTAMFAYTLSRKEVRYRKFVSFMVFFTLLFSGGLVPTYILMTQFLHLDNTIWALIFPYLTNAIHILILRNFFQSVPDSLIESARIDGSKEFNTFIKIVLPISLPSLATIALLISVFLWNDWYTPLLYVEDTNLYTLQFLLQSIMNNISFLTNNMDKFHGSSEMIKNLPNETARMATCILAIGPIILFYPFFQKFFIKGLTLGAVKG